MRKIRYRIAALAGGSVLVTLLLIMMAFNVIIRHEMHDNADLSLRMALGQGEPENTTFSFYSPEIILDTGDANTYLLPKERGMIAWCDAHDASTLQKTEISGNTYYLMAADADSLADTTTGFSYMVSDEDNSITYSYSIAGDQNFTKLIAYVDITGELNMIRQINLVFLIAAVLIGSISITIGYITGKKLEQNQLAQKQFFENTSHELKTPLTSIRGYAEGIETGVITDLPKTGRVIAAQTEKMSRLIEEILCMAKLESGSVTLQKESVELSDFVQDCLMPFEGMILTKGLHVELDLQPVTVSADPEKLEHAVSNLLTNALKYAKTEICITSDSTILRIENDCEPITNDELKHLFDRFYTGRDGNTGIGLSIAKDLIELHGWKLTAQRTETGIAFVVCLTDTK